MWNYECVVLILAYLFHPSIEITTIHHDKPEGSNIFINNKPEVNFTLTQLERQKRLLPYVNFYQTQTFNKPYQQPPKKVYNHNQNPNVIYRSKYTPFSENNVIPGPFRPMAPQRVKVQYVPIPQNKLPNFSELYDKFAQLKLTQNRRPTYVQIKRPIQQDFQVYNGQKLIHPTKTTIETFTATNIDIPSGPGENHYQYSTNKPYVTYSQDNYNTKPYQDSRKPFIIVPANPQEDANKQYYIIQRKPVTYETKYVPQQNEEYEEFPRYVNTPKYEDAPISPNYVDYDQPAPSSNVINLSTILKHLQSTNTLPKTLTPDNIDKSIKTLVKILSVLKKQSKPIIVQEEISPDYIEDVQNEAVHPNEVTGPNEAYPEDTDEGGTPGKAGVDYPALYSIPQTSFNCKTQRYKGFFGDPDTNCQVWHYCDLNGGQASFLCPNGTIFSQVALTCDWWYNVKCSSTAQLYVLNERLYKYIIPLSPKFPEDYTGPLVDKYLALKFQEMEDKMRKEKKGKGNATKEESSEPSDSEDVAADNTEKTIEMSSKVSKSHEKETLDTVEEDNPQ